VSRRGTARPGFGRADLLDPYRNLAVRVIAQAWHDLFTSDGPSVQSESARDFLCGSGMLGHWCELADMDAGAVRSRVRSFMETRQNAPGARKGH
jgi:hypothetical protein